MILSSQHNIQHIHHTHERQHFFSNAHSYAKGLQYYEEHIKAVHHEHTTVFDATPQYVMLKDVPARIQLAYPDTDVCFDSDVVGVVGVSPSSSSSSSSSSSAFISLAPKILSPR